MVRYHYDVAGNLTEKREGIEKRFLKPGGKKCRVWAVTKYAYDADGNCVHLITPKRYEKEWQYNALDRLMAEKEQDKAGGISRNIQYEYDAAGTCPQGSEHGTSHRKKISL